MLDAQGVFRVDGIVAVVTGGATGIGWMIAEALAVNGASKVFLLGRREELLTTAAAKYPAIMVPVPCDVTSKTSLEAAAEQVASTTPFVNLVVANSGITGPGSRYGPSPSSSSSPSSAQLSVAELRTQLLAPPMADFTHTFHVNVTGAWYTMVAFLALLDAGNRRAVSGEAGAFGAPRKAGGRAPSVQSQVVFISSVGAFSRHPWTYPAYGSSKAAVVFLMKQASTNLAPYGIRANAIAPGFFPSEMTVNVMQTRNPEEEGPDNPNFIPSQKFGGEEEMAGAILYLASRAGSFTNGNVLLCDGGRASVITASY